LWKISSFKIDKAKTTNEENKQPVATGESRRKPVKAM
jgi:hypothetical protein